MGEVGLTLSEANQIIWDHKLNTLPIIDKEGRLAYFVFRKDYDSHKENPNEVSLSLIHIWSHLSVRHAYECIVQ